MKVTPDEWRWGEARPPFPAREGASDMTGGMWRTVAALACVANLAACSLVPEPSAEPTGAGSAPIPQTPSGWERLVAFGTGGERAAAIGPVTLSSAPVALNATCVGSGTLVVVVAAARVDEAEAAAHPSASFPCHTPDSGIGRSTLSGTQPRTATVSAFVIHGSGYADFLVAVEQPDQEAQR